MSFAKKVKKNLKKASRGNYRTHHREESIEERKAKAFKRDFNQAKQRLIQKVKNDGYVNVTKDVFRDFAENAFNIPSLRYGDPFFLPGSMTEMWFIDEDIVVLSNEEEVKDFCKKMYNLYLVAEGI